MRIAHVNQDRGIQPGKKKGAVVHVEAMRSAWMELGVDVAAVDTNDNSLTSRELRRAHSERAVDLVYERYALSATAGARFSRAQGVPFVLEVNAPLIDEERLYRSESSVSMARETGGLSVARQAEHEIFHSATRILAVSREVANYVLKSGVPSERVRVTPNAIDIKRFHPCLRTAAARREIGATADREDSHEAIYKPGEFVVGFHGRLRPWHGLRNLASVLQVLRNEQVPVRLATVGEGDFDSELEGLDRDAVTHIGWTPHAEIPRLVAAFDAVALSYDPGRPFYFSPLKLAEAMACGVVPIVPALGDLPEIVKHLETGLVYPPGDWRALRLALRQLIEEPGLRAELSVRAAACAAKHSWTDIARDVLELAGQGCSR